jgi:2',3'-cyclic-nucleotide 2'-phosphodiesterase (5'-nucleotidase family)
VSEKLNQCLVLRTISWHWKEPLIFLLLQQHTHNSIHYPSFVFYSMIWYCHTDEFASMINKAEYPFLAVNLDFENVVLDPGTPGIQIASGVEYCEDIAGCVAKSCIMETESGIRVGLIGRAPADFFELINNSAETLLGLTFEGGINDDLSPKVSAVPQVQEQVDLLTYHHGAQVIILMDHSQDFTADPLSARFFEGIDIIVVAGSTGFMANADSFGPFNLLREEDVGEQSYPLPNVDKNGKNVLVIDSDQQYRYVGNLIVEFDGEGDIVSWDGRSGPVATTSEGISRLEHLIGMDAGELQATPEVDDILDALQASDLIVDGFTPVGTTEFPLNGFRSVVRNRETNLSRLAADSTLWAGNAFAAANGLPMVDIALKNGGGIRDSITGPVIIRLAIRAALAFDNQLTLVEMTATQLVAAMENCISRFPATDGRLCHVAGMTMVFDPSKVGIEGEEEVITPSRVKELTVTKQSNGSVDTLVSDYTLVGSPDRTFVMATNNYLVTGGDGYVSLKAGIKLGTTDQGEQVILEEYINEVLGGTVSIMQPPPMPRIVEMGTF